MGIPMLKIRRSRDRLILNMGIPILARHLHIEMAPRFRIQHLIMTMEPRIHPSRIIASSSGELLGQIRVSDQIIVTNIYCSISHTKYYI